MGELFFFYFCASHPFVRSVSEAPNYFWLGADGIAVRLGLVFDVVVVPVLGPCW